MKYFKWYIVLFLLLFVGYFYLQSHRPRPLDWTPSFSSYDKIPFGTYILFQELEKIFPGQSPKIVAETPYDHTNQNLSEGEVYLLIAGSAQLSPTDLKALLKYVERGNTLFLATAQMGRPLMDTLKVKIGGLDNPFSQLDTGGVNLVNPALRSPKPYTMEGAMLNGYFSKIDSSKFTVLGTDRQGNANYICMKWGQGWLFLHAAPAAFTNYFMLSENNGDYVGKALSYLPEKPGGVFWDEYYKPKRGAGQSGVLKVINEKKNLKLAFWLVLAGVLLFLIFQTRRRQRIIPIIKPHGNDTLEFVETVSRVYFNQNTHISIAHKKILYWQEFLRSRYGIMASEMTASDFPDILAHRSGLSPEFINELLGMVRFIRSSGSITPPELTKINSQIDKFYKYSRL